MDIVSAKVAADKAMEYVSELAPEAKCIALDSNVLALLIVGIFDRRRIAGNWSLEAATRASAVWRKSCFHPAW